MPFFVETALLEEASLLSKEERRFADVRWCTQIALAAWHLPDQRRVAGSSVRRAKLARQYPRAACGHPSLTVRVPKVTPSDLGIFPTGPARSVGATFPQKEVASLRSRRLIPAERATLASVITLEKGHQQDLELQQ